MTARGTLAARVLAALVAVGAVSPSCFTQRHAAERFLGIDGPELPPPIAFRDDELDIGGVRRILALPFVDESQHGGATAELLNGTLRDELARLRRFEVVLPAASDPGTAPEESPHRTGQVPIEALIDLGKRYGVDGIVFGSITEYRAYTPPRLALKLSMVDTQTGRVLWQVNDFVDASDARTAVSMNNFFRKQIAIDGTAFGAEAMVTSPELFARFATRRVTETLAGP